MGRQVECKEGVGTKGEGVGEGDVHNADRLTVGGDGEGIIITPPHTHTSYREE